MEGDAWVLSFADAENRLLSGGCRKKCLSLLKTLRDRHLDLPGIQKKMLNLNNFPSDSVQDAQNFCLMLKLWREN